jgi:hypothetical protein
MSEVPGIMGMIEEVLNDGILIDHNLPTAPTKERVLSAMPRKNVSSVHGRNRGRKMLDDVVASSVRKKVVGIVVV